MRSSQSGHSKLAVNELAMHADRMTEAQRDAAGDDKQGKCIPGEQRRAEHDRQASSSSRSTATWPAPSARCPRPGRSDRRRPCVPNPEPGSKACSPCRVTAAGAMLAATSGIVKFLRPCDETRKARRRTRRETTFRGVSATANGAGSGKVVGDAVMRSVIVALMGACPGGERRQRRSRSKAG